MRQYIIFIYLIFSISGYSQVGVEDSISLNNNLSSAEKNMFHGELKLKNDWFKIDQIKSERPDFMNVDWTINRAGEYEIVMPALKKPLYPPVFNELATSNPFAYDYGFYDYKELSNEFYITSVSEQNTYPTMGTVRMVNGSLNYDATSWLTISGGAYMSKYTMYGHLYRDIGTNGSMRFYIGNRVRINAFGQYSVYEKENGVGYYQSDMYPQSYYGGSLEFKVSSKFGVEAGVVRELDPFSGKWKDRRYIAPVFYYGKKH